MAQTVSVVIPNYNGKKLLSQNLPKAIDYCQGCEIIVVDDASGDDSVEYLEKEFPQVKIVKLAKNRGFVKAVNEGVKAATGKFILLLNSDVALSSNFLKDALSHFKNDRVFAVALADQSHEKGKVITRGRGGASFRKGFVVHFALKATTGETLWVSGGSGLFVKDKFLELGGFDPIFAPFYWEDIDLSFRAWRKGWQCLFDPQAKVDHHHEEGAVKKSYSQFFIKSVSFKNQFLFVWKNIADPFWLTQHLLWLPYHFTKAMFNVNMPFFIGFAWAILKIPSLIFDYQLSTINYQLSDREVLQKFA